MHVCKCGYKSVKHMGQCPMCKGWNTLVEEVVVKKAYQIPKVSAKKKREIEASKGNNELEIWFKERRKEMTGFCKCGCGAKSSKDDDKFYKCSIAHLVPKSRVKSIATHPLNWVELSFWGGCHTNMDNLSSDKWVNMACWDEILQKFLLMLPEIDEKEYKYIPKVFNPYIGN